MLKSLPQRRPKSIKIWGFTTVVPRAGSMAGGATFYHEMCKAFIRAGFIVEIQVPRNRIKKAQTIDGVLYTTSTHYEDADAIFLHSASLDNNPDIRIFEQPVLYLMHSESDLIKSDLNRLSKKDVLIANSESLQEKIKDYPCQHMVIYPICNRIYREQEPNEKKYITTIGSSVVKNVGLFYELSKYYPKEIFLHVKGGYGNAKCYGTENTRFINNTDNLKPIYLKTKVLLVPSFSETYSLVAREAGLLGIPVIASDLPGIHENLGAAGLYADPNDIDTFKQKLDYILKRKNYAGMSRIIRNHCLREEQENDERVNSLIEFLRHLRS